MQGDEITGGDQAKRAAARAAAAMVEDGMKLGLGSGTTVIFLLEVLARRIRDEGLQISGVPTSSKTADTAARLGIALGELTGTTDLDLSIDGADEVESSRLFLIKGHGGALLREKMVATAARRFVVIVDESKIVPALGTRMAVPVEVARFGHGATARRIENTLGKTSLRRTGDGAPFVTDNGNFIYDATPAEAITEPPVLERALQAIPGVLANGLFTLPVARVFVGSATGTVRTLEGSART